MGVTLSSRDNDGRSWEVVGDFGVLGVGFSRRLHFGGVTDAPGAQGRGDLADLVNGAPLGPRSERLFGWGYLSNLKVLCSFSYWALFHHTPIWAVLG